MIYRALDSDGDYALGSRGAFLRDQPEAVVQAVVTRLRLLAGEWFLDLAEGTPYTPAVLGKHTADSYDLAIRARILGTEGVTRITAYESGFDGESRRLTVTARIDTIYGPTELQEVL